MDSSNLVWFQFKSLYLLNWRAWKFSGVRRHLKKNENKPKNTTWEHRLKKRKHHFMEKIRKTNQSEFRMNCRTTIESPHKKNLILLSKICWFHKKYFIVSGRGELCESESVEKFSQLSRLNLWKNLKSTARLTWI